MIATVVLREDFSIIITYLIIIKLHKKINKTAFTTGRGLLNKTSFLGVHIADFTKIKS